MRYDFHGVTVETQSPDSSIQSRWAATFASRPAAIAAPDVHFSLQLAEQVPPAPAAEPHFRQGDLLQYYLNGAHVTARFPRFGQLRLDLATGEVEGRILPAALETHGVFEDLVAIGLSPLLRRRDMFLLHAFAATLTPDPRLPRPAVALTPDQDLGFGAVLLVGDIGAGKTTTGLALLHAGWKLLSNDSPILKDEGRVEVLAYPGLLSAHADSLARFPELHPLLENGPPQTVGRQKTLFAAEDYYPAVWTGRAPARALIFPRIEARTDHALDPLPAPEALRMLLPNAIEQWDREMIPHHLSLLRKLVDQAPAYRLRLGPNVDAIADILSRMGAE